MENDASQTTDSDLETAINALRDCAFLARNLRPRSRRAFDYIERYANERLARLGAKPSETTQEVTLLEKRARRESANAE